MYIHYKIENMSCYIIDYLKNPILVANIQKFFGVKLCENEATKVNKSPEHSSKKKPYEITNKFWYYLFVFGTALGDEVFYASFIPFWFWNIDGAVGRRVVLVWTIVMYIGIVLLNTKKLRFYVRNF